MERTDGGPGGGLSDSDRLGVLVNLKLRIAKPCETRLCETLLILRNKRKTAKKKYLRILAKPVFAKLAKNDLRNLAKP